MKKIPKKIGDEVKCFRCDGPVSSFGPTLSISVSVDETLGKSIYYSDRVPVCERCKPLAYEFAKDPLKYTSLGPARYQVEKEAELKSPVFCMEIHHHGPSREEKDHDNEALAKAVTRDLFKGLGFDIKDEETDADLAECRSFGDEADEEIVQPAEDDEVVPEGPPPTE